MASGSRVGSSQVLLVALVGAYAPAGCAFSPITRVPQLVALTERQEITAGREALLELERTRRFGATPAAEALVSSTGSALAEIAPGSAFPYAFYVLDTPEANAFAFPGGVVVVTRGLLLLCNSEDELAGVLGHEIGHVAARHASSRLALELPATAVARIAGWGVGVVSREQGEAIFTSLPRLLLAPYGRGQEREADREGVVLAASLGFDPRALARLLARLQDNEEATRKASAKATILDSHPPTPSRIALIETLAAELDRTLRRDPADYLATLDGMVIGEDVSVGAWLDNTLIMAEARAALETPTGWMRESGEQQFIAVAPFGKAVLKVRLTTLEEAQRTQLAVQRESGLLDFATEQRGAWQAVRAELRHGDDGRSVGLWHWFTSASGAVELTTTYRADDQREIRPLVDAVAASLRSPSGAELESLTATRLRLLRIEADTTLESLARASDSAWSAAELAVFNGLPLDGPVLQGTVLKFARREPLVLSAPAP